MKRIMLVVAMALALTASNAMADSAADIDVSEQSTSFDGAFSSTWGAGNWNDGSQSFAGGKAGSNVDADASASGEGLHCTGSLIGCLFGFGWELAPNPAIVGGGGASESESKAWAWSNDSGQTSKAGAGAKTEGGSIAGGFATGIGGGPESVVTTNWVGGVVEQSNTAGETGYSNGQYATGGNLSGGSFLASETNGGVSGFLGAIGGGHISGGMITKGKTEVTIDPYGGTRSASAMTENMTEVNTHHDIVSSGVIGFGGVDVNSAKGASYAGGTANFGYIGYTSGEGNAQVQGTTNGGTSSVSGSAYAVGNVGPGPQ